MREHVAVVAVREGATLLQLFLGDGLVSWRELGRGLYPKVGWRLAGCRHFTNHEVRQLSQHKPGDALECLLLGLCMVLV